MQDLIKKFTFLIVIVIAFFALFRFFAGPIFKKEGRLGGEPVNRKDLMTADRMGRLISEIADKTTPSVVFVRTEQTKTRGTIFGQVFKLRRPVRRRMAVGQHIERLSFGLLGQGNRPKTPRRAGHGQPASLRPEGEVSRRVVHLVAILEFEESAV